MSFKFWPKSPLPEDIAYRYVCIPHTPTFWDHVVVGTHTPNSLHSMLLAQDDHLPKLFNVNMKSIGFHWCCFVFADQILLAMWCTRTDESKLATVVPISDTSIRHVTDHHTFKSMVYYLYTWFKVQYTHESHRKVNVVLDCTPSESPTFVHILCLLAAKCGMGRVDLSITQNRPSSNLNHMFNANAMFKSVVKLDCCKTIDIVEEFSRHHNENFKMPRVYTNTGQCRYF